MSEIEPDDLVKDIRAPAIVLRIAVLLISQSAYHAGKHKRTQFNFAS
jgi:hypothetical protein